MDIFSDDKYKSIQLGYNTYDIIDDGDDPLKAPNVRIGSTFEIDDQSNITNMSVGIVSDHKYEILDNKNYLNDLKTIKGTVDPGYFRDKLNQAIHELNIIKSEYHNDKKIVELVETSLASIQDLKDELNGRFAKVSYDELKRSINISLSEVANNNLKDLILNKTNELTKEDINKIEDCIEDKIIKYIENKDY